MNKVVPHNNTKVPPQLFQVVQTKNSSNAAHHLPETKEALDNHSMSNLTSDVTGKNGTNFSRVEGENFPCHEDFEEYGPYLDNARFWIEGVLKNGERIFPPLRLNVRPLRQRW